jgi:CRP-like cAMP-binding protein
VVALTDCEVVVLNAESIGAVTSRNPQLTHDLNRVAAARHQRLATPPEIVVETVGAGTELPDAAPPAGEGESGGGESGS